MTYAFDHFLRSKAKREKRQYQAETKEKKVFLRELNATVNLLPLEIIVFL